MIRRLGTRSLIIFAAFIGLSSIMQAQFRFNVFSPETKNYPYLRAFYEAADLNNVPVPGLVSTDFEIIENGIKVPAASISQKCSTIIDGPELSVVLVLDKSASMDEQVGPRPEDTRFSFVKKASKLFISQLNFIGRTAVSIVSFDGQSYLEHDWSNNRNSLLAAIDKIELGSATAYDPPLLHKQWGAIKMLSERPAEPVKRVIIFLTDGEPNRKPTVDTIKKGLLDNGIVFYGITAYTGMNKDIASWATLTGGSHYEANSMDAYAKLQEIFSEIAKKLQAKEVCYLDWKSPMGCDDSSRNRTVFITLKKNVNLIDTSYYQAPASSVMKIDVNPPIVAFGNPAPSASVDKTVDITAKNGPLTITADPPPGGGGATFTITEYNGSAWNGTTPQTIDSGKTATIKIRFTQGSVLDYRQSALQVLGNPCDPPLIPLVGGAADVILLDPITSEIRSTCNDLTILWAGVDSAQQVIIQYSSDNGTTWNLLTDKGTGLKYIWSSEELKKLNTKGQFKIRVGLPPQKTYVWAKSIGGTLADSSVSIALSPDGQNSFIAGSFVGNGTFDSKPMASNGGSRDGFYAKVDISGNATYVKSIGGTNEDQITGIAAGDNDVAYITGWFIGDATFGSVTKSQASDKTKRNFFMARVQPDGNTVIVRDLGPRANANGEAFGERIAWDPFEKRIYVEGMFKGTLSTMIGTNTATISNRTQPIVWKPFTAIFDANGNWLDLQPTRTQGKPYTSLTATDKDGCIYETGTYTGTITRDPGNKSLTSTGLTDGFITKFCGTPASSSTSPKAFPLAKARLYSVDSNIRFSVGSTAVGTPKEQVLSAGICNDGNLDTFIDSVSVSDPQFSLKTVLNGRLFPSVNCDTVPIEVLFVPATPGEHCTTVTFYATCSPVVKMTICGTAVEPCNYTFVSDTSAPKTLVGSKSTITMTQAFCNTSNIVLSGKLTIAGPNGSDFKIVDINGSKPAAATDTTYTILPNKCLQIGVEFAPTAIGKRFGFIDLNLPSDCGIAKIQLSGEGEAQLTASATDAIWGCVPVGGKDVKQVTISNNGGSEASIKSIRLLTNNGTFALRNIPALPQNLTKGQSITVDVEFAPTVNANGLWDSVLVNAVATADQTQIINFGSRVQGNGCVGMPSYTKNCFDSTMIGSKSPAKTNALVIKNMGQGPLTVNSITAITPNEFESFTPIAPFTIPLNGQQDISAVFIPQGKGLRTGSLVILTDASPTPDTVQLCGTGYLADTTINFGTVNACETPSVTIPYPNMSKDPITITASVTGDATQFSLTPNGTTTIPGNSAFNNYTIAFIPTAAGTFNATAQIGERKVMLKGSAITLPMTVTSSINPGRVKPGELVKLKVSTKIDNPVGTANINAMQITLSYDASDLEYANKITSLNGWTWSPAATKTSIVVNGNGAPGLKGQQSIDLFELDYNAYLGDSTHFDVKLEAAAGSEFAKCLVITPVNATLALDQICFSNGRFIRGSSVGYKLAQSGESPATETATIDYSVGLAGHTIIELYNSMGQKTHTLLEGNVREGEYQMSIDTRSLPAGMYICIMKSGPYAAQQQLIITK